MPCLLHIIGESFDPSALPELAVLRPYSTYLRGDSSSGGSRLLEAGGISCEVSPHFDWIKMVDDSVAFLARHHELLQKLAQQQSVTHRSLAFVPGRSETQQRTGCFSLPPCLLRYCAEVELTINLRIIHFDAI